MDQKLDPKSAHVQKLAKQWQNLVKEFTGGNPAIETKLKTAYQNYQAFIGGPTQTMMEFISQAVSA